jgi:hypothetical protein
MAMAHAAVAEKGAGGRRMKRSNVILLGVLVLLAVAAVVVLQQPGERSTDAGAAETLVSYDSAAVDNIEILTRGTKVTLRKEGATWMLTSPLRAPAATEAVTAAISRGRDMRPTGLVSSNPQKQSVFQVDSLSTLVRFSRQGNTVAAFRLGKNDQSWSGTFVRLEGSNDVYLVQGVLGYVFEKGVKDWRNRTIFAAPQQSIQSVRFQYGDTTFTLAFADSVWTVEGEATTDHLVRAFLGAVSALSADEFIDSVTVTLPQLTATLEIQGTVLRFYRNPASGDYYVTSSRSPQVYEIQAWRAAQVLRRRTEFHAPA